MRPPGGPSVLFKVSRLGQKRPKVKDVACGTEQKPLLKLYRVKLVE